MLFFPDCLLDDFSDIIFLDSSVNLTNFPDNTNLPDNILGSFLSTHLYLSSNKSFINTFPFTPN